MPNETKRERLRELGALNARPEAVRAPWFRESTFFDPLDLVQVKYEMLRHVQEDGVNKADAAALFGLSRPTYYQAEAAFERDGIAGLLPRTRGPKSAHKLTDEVMQLIEQNQHAGAPLQARSLAELLHSTLGISVHPRSIERAIARKKKTVSPMHAPRCYRAAARISTRRCAPPSFAVRPAPRTWAPSFSTAFGKGWRC
ncbi:putative transposase number 2 for insertion sequence NGRIS-4f (plasmid) [Sinorhizobium fredii NGR234]|uniref:Transposase number 2 for insertion sequence NGRIS-4f n=1 Tax=Sinorhizobium fredii (strain NBRC 101917 / NGR234) TaxID=394 RepID=C3KQM6_SINFN|nr:helix-turn-helix domain-containing protein [Sinorhizobium fredii]ACP22384.1 putative transposase number 2 for insertion sequence NGRIS-4f [Sinorhizobium fredii NGR234]